jgi:histidine ammonia-lyase
MPASVFSRSTEGHNQDKVSMGSIAALDLAQILDLTETVAAVTLIAFAQAVELRGLSGMPEPIRALHAAVRERVARTDEDRRMDGDISAVLGLIRADALPLAAQPLPAELL